MGVRASGRGDAGLLPISSELHRHMVEVARDFRKAPTPSEGLLWRVLRGRKLRGAKFRRQQPIGPFVVDFFCAEQALIVEVDGPIHGTQVERDQEWQTLLEACGYRVLRVSAADVEQNMGAVLSQLKAVLVLSRAPGTEQQGIEGHAPLSRTQGEGPGVREPSRQ